MLDPNDPTWVTIEKRLNERRAECVASLINGSPSDDKLRGKIQLIDDLIQEVHDDGRPPELSSADY